VRLYAFLRQIIPYGDRDLEMLFTFGKLLIRKLHVGSETERLDLQDDVSLQYYRLQRISSGPIDLSDGEAITVKSPTDVGTGKATDEKAPLSAVVTVLAKMTFAKSATAVSERPAGSPEEEKWYSTLNARTRRWLEKAKIESVPEVLQLELHSRIPRSVRRELGEFQYAEQIKGGFDPRRPLDAEEIRLRLMNGGLLSGGIHIGRTWPFSKFGSCTRWVGLMCTPRIGLPSIPEHSKRIHRTLSSHFRGHSRTSD
jgi:hypothetical protein